MNHRYGSKKFLFLIIIPALFSSLSFKIQTLSIIRQISVKWLDAHQLKLILNVPKRKQSLIKLFLFYSFRIYLRVCITHSNLLWIWFFLYFLRNFNWSRLAKGDKTDLLGSKNFHLSKRNLILMAESVNFQTDTKISGNTKSFYCHTYGS